MNYYTQNICLLEPFEVFVFGSNLAGRHGAGAALHAEKYFGAVYGEGVGRTGQCYAIPTKDKALGVLSLFSIKQYVHYFLEYAYHHPELTFYVTKVGCGLAGYSDNQIAPMFNNAPDNCYFHIDWERYLE